jgi:hypothetical protein
VCPMAGQLASLKQESERDKASEWNSNPGNPILSRGIPVSFLQLSFPLRHNQVVLLLTPSDVL